MYELFILGELMDQPMHGYLLREIINLAIGPFRQMSWGALYPLLRRLEAEGLIQQVPEPATGDRQRKVYQIMPAGRQRFMFLMLRPEEYGPEYPDRFDTRLLNFDHLDAQQRLDRLQQYRGYVQFMLSTLSGTRSFVASEPQIAEAERQWILKIMDHRIHLASADLEWITALQAELQELS